MALACSAGLAFLPELALHQIVRAMVYSLSQGHIVPGAMILTGISPNNRNQSLESSQAGLFF